MTSNYTIILRFSEEDGGYVATVPELPGVSAVGTTPDEAAGEVRDAISACIESLREEGKDPPPPSALPSYSGQLRLRMPRSLHARLAGQAEMEGTSLNSYIVHLLSEGGEAAELRREMAELRRLLNDLRHDPRRAPAAAPGQTGVQFGTQAATVQSMTTSDPRRLMGKVGEKKCN